MASRAGRRVIENRNVVITAKAVKTPKSITTPIPVAARLAKPRAVVREVKKQDDASPVNVSTTAVLLSVPLTR
jgi:hypothetical protein